jgi:alkanesulfonate monooxygenase SsuD/methylene tetrahydromethanopterin reductase-like flavin-dependent oxidoreductase (luciferase family)
MDLDICVASRIEDVDHVVRAEQLGYVRHLRIHAGHDCWVVPDEERFLAPALLDAGRMIGTRHQLVERLGALSDAGVDQVMVIPSSEPRFDVLEQVGTEILPRPRS